MNFITSLQSYYKSFLVKLGPETIVLLHLCVKILGKCLLYISGIMYFSYKNKKHIHLSISMLVLWNSLFYLRNFWVIGQLLPK
jgi:hypothetical protein